MEMLKSLDIPKCGFSDDVLPYMYGEMPSSEISAFESHLLDCDECTDELAAVSFARYEVYDWKKLEFDPLPTPRFMPVETAAAEVKTASWLGGLRATFARGSLGFVPEFALVAIGLTVAGVVYFAGMNKPDTAKIETAPAVVSRSAPSPENERSVADNVPVVETPRAVVPAVARTGNAKRVTPIRATRLPRSSVARTVRTVRDRQPTPTIPRLNEFSEDEDTSLRLAQLFDDVDTRD
jgi:hypothetical protein